MGAWRGRSGQGELLLPRPGQRPLASLGTFVVAGRKQISWPSRGSAEGPSIGSPTSVFLATAMALKYVLLALFTLLQLRGDGSRRDNFANL